MSLRAASAHLLLAALPWACTAPERTPSAGPEGDGARRPALSEESAREAAPESGPGLAPVAAPGTAPPGTPAGPPGAPQESVSARGQERILEIDMLDNGSGTEPVDATAPDGRRFMIPWWVSSGTPRTTTTAAAGLELAPGARLSSPSRPTGPWRCVCASRAEWWGPGACGWKTAAEGASSWSCGTRVSPSPAPTSRAASAAPQSRGSCWSSPRRWTPREPCSTTCGPSSPGPAPSPGTSPWSSTVFAMGGAHLAGARIRPRWTAQHRVPHPALRRGHRREDRLGRGLHPPAVRGPAGGLGVSRRARMERRPGDVPRRFLRAGFHPATGLPRIGTARPTCPRTASRWKWAATWRS
jgi:hypothetical protein